jgi:hypothetical protein
MPGLPVEFSVARPSGCATTVRAPLSATTGRFGREAPGASEPVRLYLGDPAAKEPRRLARVRRQEPRRRGFPAEPEASGQRGESIGVHYHRPRDVPYQRPHRLPGLRVQTDPRADREGIHA